MRRAILLLLAALAGVGGLLQVAPSGAPATNFDTREVGHFGGAAAVPTVWYCPWIEAGDVLDSAIAVASDSDAVVNMTLLDPLANAEPTEFSFDIVGPSATAIETGNLLRRGESPAIVEISNGPAAAISMQWADGQIAADRCIVSVPKDSYLTGGSTKTGSFTQLRLFNPFADNAEVAITAYSEFNLDLIPNLDTIDVAGRSWTTIDFEPFLPFRDELAFKISATKGLVIPILVRTDERGEATWNAMPPSETWDFPVAAPGGLTPSVAVMSAGDDAVVVTVDIVTEQGTILNAREITIDSTAPALIPIADLADPPFGLRVRATAPIAATVVAVVAGSEIGGGEGGAADGETEELPTTTTVEGTETTVPVVEEFIRGLAGTTGSATSSTSWIVPLDTLPGSETTLWLMNNEAERATVSILELGEGDFLAAESVVVEPESVLGIPVDAGIGTYGYSVTSDRPIVAAWEIVGDRGVALIAGIHAQ